MNTKLFGRDWSLTWPFIPRAFMLFLYVCLAIGVVRSLVNPSLRYFDFENLAPTEVLLPERIDSISQDLAFSRFYIGNDLSKSFCSGEATFKIAWNDRSYATQGRFLDLSQPLEPSELQKPLEILGQLNNGASFHTGPAPGITGYEQLAAGDFRFVVGKLTDPATKLSTLTYARNADWLCFSSKFAPPQPNANGPWAIYEDDALYPWLGSDLLSDLPAGTLTAMAVTHQIDFREIPIEWKNPQLDEYEWVTNSASHSSQQILVESYSNYRAALVVAALQLPNNRPILVLFSAHDKKLLAANTLPADLSPGISFARLRFSPDGLLIAAYDFQGVLYFFQTKTLQLLRRYPKVDGRSSPEKTVRLAFNSRGDKFLAPSKDGDLVEVDFIKDRLQKLGSPYPINTFAYSTSFDDVDTVVAVSRENGYLIKYRLDNGTAAREEKILLAGLYPQAQYLNFSEDGTKLTATVTEASKDWKTPPAGKQLHQTESRLLLWNLSQTHLLDRVPASTRSWRLKNGAPVYGTFVRLDRRDDGWHVVVDVEQSGLLDIPSQNLTKDDLDHAILLSAVVRPPQDLSTTGSR